MANLITEIDLPLRFTVDGDVALTTIDRAVYNNILSCAFLKRKGIPLRPLIGSNVSMDLFDPNDVIMRESIIASVREAIRYGEPRVQLGKIIEIEVDNSGAVAGLAIDYFYRSSNAGWKTATVDGEKIL